MADPHHRCRGRVESFSVTPSCSIPSMARTLSTVFPKRSDRAPDELFSHIPDGAARHRRRLDPEAQAVLAKKIVQCFQNAAGPDAQFLRRGIIIRHAVEMPGHVQDQPIPDRLAVLGRAPTLAMTGTSCAAAIDRAASSQP